MILGAGSASFEILRYLVDRLPLMITPRWVDTECQPIGIRNVLDYLAGCLAACIQSRSAKYLLVALPIVAQAGVMSLAGMSPDFRYHWAINLTGLLMSRYLLLAIPRREGKFGKI